MTAIGAKRTLGRLARNDHFGGKRTFAYRLRPVPSLETLIANARYLAALLRSRFPQDPSREIGARQEMRKSASQEPLLPPVLGRGRLPGFRLG